MALDVYAGPLTVYYSGQWENIGQAEARKRGFEYHQIRLRDESDAVGDPETVRRMVVDWRQGLSNALGDNLPSRLDWDEQTEDYMTARPDFEGLGALILWASYAEHPDLPRPEQYVDFAEDPAYGRSAPNDAQSHFPAIIRETEFWLPADFEFTFKAPGPNGDAVMFSSAYGLFRQLRKLNEMTWQADQQTIQAWSVDWPGASASLEALAKYAFSDMVAVASYACTKRMPIKLDY
ncbi:MAG: hypothetical protein EPO67_10705 [Reyranella sp.]|nr:MAG: hypothetical protein EPO67_10705 [Reyranella sp.]